MKKHFLFSVRPLALCFNLTLFLLLFSCQEKPPVEEGDFLASDMVELTKLDSTLKLDIRYATTNNFIGQKVYEEARAFLQRPAAEALIEAHEELKSQGYGFIIFDGYRPWSITKLFWDLTPEDKKIYVANPKRGSRHNRGCAIDLTLYDLATGKAVEMTSDFDELEENASSTYTGGTAEQRANRDLLISTMHKHGFKVISSEWWHFDYQGWENYRIENIQFDEIN